MERQNAHVRIEYYADKEIKGLRITLSKKELKRLFRNPGCQIFIIGKDIQKKLRMPKIVIASEFINWGELKEGEMVEPSGCLNKYEQVVSGVYDRHLEYNE